MFHTIATALIFVLIFMGLPLAYTGTSAYKAARSFALGTNEVQAASGADADVVYFFPVASSQNGSGASCANFRMLIKGSRGFQWAGVQVYRPGTPPVWQFARFRLGTRGMPKRCAAMDDNG
jgi:hypothetical protein